MLPFFVLVVFVVGPIYLVWGKTGHALERFVAWWCDLVGVVDPGAVQTATGTFAALSLFATIWMVWLFMLNIVAWLDAQER